MTALALFHHPKCPILVDTSLPCDCPNIEERLTDLERRLDQLSRMTVGRVIP